MTAPATLLPALGAAAVASAMEYSKGERVDPETIAMVGGVAAAALGISLMLEENDYYYGGALALVGAAAAILSRR